MKKFLFLLLSVFFISNSLFATTNDKHIFYLDNPTDKNIKITLDSKVYNLKPKTYEILNLKRGEHIAELSDGTKVYFKIFANSKGGIINPSGATYTINYFRYQSPRISVDWQEPEDTVLPTYNDFIMDKNYIAWEYDIFEEVTRESMPKKLHPDVDIHVFTKIYSPSELKEPDYTKGKPIEVYNFKKSDIDIENPKANLPKIDSDYNIPKDEDKALGQLTMKLETKDLEKNAYYHGIVVPVDDNVQEGRPSKEFCFNIEKGAFAEGAACETFGVSVAQPVAVETATTEATTEADEEHSAAGADMKLADISHTIEGNKIYLSWTALPQSSDVLIELFNKETNDFVSLGTVPMSQQKFEYTINGNEQEFLFMFTPKNSRGRQIRYPVNVRHETEVTPDLKPVEKIKVGPVEDMMLILGVTLLLYVGYRVYASRKTE